jgi:hypothetical protein
MTTSARPDNIPSATTLAEEPSSLFSEREYQALRQRYLEKRKRTGEDAALPGGMRLRQKTAQPAIRNGTPYTSYWDISEVGTFDRFIFYVKSTGQKIQPVRLRGLVVMHIE